MNVSLTPELEAMIREKVESGRYASASEVVREALRILEANEMALDQLRAEVQKGIDAVNRGETVEFNEHTMERLKQRAMQERREGKPIRDAIKP